MINEGHKPRLLMCFFFFYLFSIEYHFHRDLYRRVFFSVFFFLFIFCCGLITGIFNSMNITTRTAYKIDINYTKKKRNIKRFLLLLCSEPQKSWANVFISWTFRIAAFELIKQKKKKHKMFSANFKRLVEPLSTFAVWLIWFNQTKRKMCRIRKISRY